MPGIVIERDRWGRPKVPDPKTGKPRYWTRTTTLAKAIDDTFGLEAWGKRQVIKGIVARSDELLLRAAAAWSPGAKEEDKSALDRIAADAMEAARSHERRELGTALHSITERIDNGEEVEHIPAAFAPDVEAYRGAMARSGLEVVPGWLERFVVCPAVEAAGTADKLLTHRDHLALPVIGDTKTGSKVVWHEKRTGEPRINLSIPAQLAIYSRASHWFDGERLHEMPPVNQDVGVVIALPAGEGRCEVYTVDLNVGWEVAQLCYEVHKMRKRKGLVAEWRVAAEPATHHTDEPTDKQNDAAAEREERLRARVADIAAGLEGAALPHPWPAGVNPPKRQGLKPYTVEELRRIAAWCDRVAPATTAAPF